MPDALYESDALAWSEQQSALLRRIAAGERLNEAVDWPHVIEELADVGLSELRACQSLLQQSLTHLLKLGAWPDHQAASHWRDEAGAFLDDAARRFTPSMAQRIELASLYAKALRRARSCSSEPPAWPQSCPFALPELLAGEVIDLAIRLRPTPA